MASQIPGFEYDIFISYRQKDNKGERWVTAFVEALKTELESTFKEEISLYFDVNPHDGLLETYDVNASLSKKLNCLVFIPVISRTYCDPNSFAWEHEFKAFVEQSNNDRFGLKISLPNGNVISRILPVRIHELDIADIKLCESVLGGMIRGVEFVYKSSGVNRPLRPVEEHPHDNINKTYYRDQINKVANSIKDIIQGLIYSGQVVVPVNDKIETVRDFDTGKRTFSYKMVRRILLVLFLLICISGIYIYISVYHSSITERTIAIIPQTNPPDDPELLTCAVGSMDAIITKLYEIKKLTVRGRFTSFQYLDTRKSILELRKELKSNYLVEINVSRSSDKLKMWVGLTDTRKDKQMWAQQYEWNEEQLMPIFTKVVQTIAENLNINFTNNETINIEKDLTQNPEAYLNYLKASAQLISVMGNKFLDTNSFRSIIKLYDKAIVKDPEFASAYARRAIALSWGIHTGELDISNSKKCWSDINTAAKINKDLTDVQIAYGFYYYYCSKDYTNALISFNTAAVKDPENYKPLFYMALVYRAMGDWNKAHALLDKVIKFDPKDPLDLTNIGLSFDYMHDYDSALIFHQKAIKVRPDWSAAYLNKFGSLLSKYGNTPEVRSLIDSITGNSPEKLSENRILLDMYDGKYQKALSKAKESSKNDFTHKGARFIYLGNISALLNDKLNADKYFDSALVVLNLALKSDSADYYIHGQLGLTYAGLGRKYDAISEGKKAIQLTISDQNNMNESDMIVNLAQIYTTLGLYQDALQNIEYSLKNPSTISTKLLQIEPAWKPLRDRTEFKTIIAKYEKR